MRPEVEGVLGAVELAAAAIAGGIPVADAVHGVLVAVSRKAVPHLDGIDLVVRFTRLYCPPEHRHRARWAVLRLGAPIPGRRSGRLEDRLELLELAANAATHLVAELEYAGV